MANRVWPSGLRCLVITLALLNVFTIGGRRRGGQPAARPSRAWKIPRVAAPAGRPRWPGAGRRDAVRPAADPRRAGRGAVRPLVSSPALGPQVAAVVTDPASGRVLLASGRPSLLTPASTTKLATAVAALTVLGPGGPVHHAGGRAAAAGHHRPGRRR